jgi:muramoyltetrapeptide carboxypeptidase
MPMRIGIVALSSVVPPVEFAAGVQHLRANGFDVIVHPQVTTQHWLHAGDDATRAGALFEFARDDSIDVVWCARGGYGAAKLLPLLDRLTAERGVPPSKKLLVGYSDVTVMHEYVRGRWGWNTLHAAMPAAANFASLPPRDWWATQAAVRREPRINWPWAASPLRWLTAPPAQPIEAPLIGGNLSLWQTLAGTPYAPPRRPHILFLEDLAEKFYRIDRMMTHVAQAGLLDTCVALVLGDLTDCSDEAQTCAAPDPAGPRQPLRPTFEFEDLLREVFVATGQRQNIPVAIGLAVGHGPNFAPLPLGARYRLDAGAGTLGLIEWDWLNSPAASPATPAG